MPVGQAAANLEQLSYAAVSGMLRGVRDRLQGSAPASPTSQALPYSPVDFDQSFASLGYAANQGDNNPLMPLKAPAARIVAGPTGPTWAVWSEGFGDWERRTPLNAADIGRTQTSSGVHTGIDGTWQGVLNRGDYLLVGVLGDWMRTNVSFAGTSQGFQLEGPGVGLYSMYLLGNFSADMTAKADFLSLAENFAGFAPDATSNVTNAGVSANIQYKNLIGHTGFAEPTMGFSFTRTMFGDNAAALGLTDGSTLRLQSGLRFGNTFDFNGVSVEPTLALLVYSNVVAEGTSLPTTPIPIPLSPTDRGLVRGEVDPELNVDFNNGYSAYFRSVVRFGSELFGATAKVGLRKTF